MVIYPLKMVIFYGFCEKFTTTNRQDFAEVRGPRGVGADEARCGTDGVEGSHAAATVLGDAWNGWRGEAYGGWTIIVMINNNL